MPINEDTFLKTSMVDYDAQDLFGSEIEVSTYAIKIIKEYYSKTMNITPNHSLVYKGDFYGLLAKYRIPSYIFHLTALINGFKTSSDLTEEMSSILVVDPKYLNDIETLILNEKKEQIMTV